MPVHGVLEAGRVPVKVWTPLHELESEAKDQLTNISNLPFVFKHVAAMPDVHLGKGATVGSVIAMEKAVIPAAVGVDIGCGMAAVRTSLTSRSFGDGDLAKLRRSIERGVPVGRNSHKSPTAGARAWAAKPRATRREIETRHLSQLGTLGGGNHFIEVCVDTTDRVWIMLHSGSRNLGKTLAEGHIKAARKLMDLYHVRLDDPDLAYLVEGSPEFTKYVSDVLLAQDYAMENRRLMLEEVKKDIAHLWPEVIFDDEVNCHHNYLSREEHFGKEVIVTRQGAIRAGAGDLGIIPGSMGTKSYIVRGKGNPDSFHSCSHGAGRRMSRTKAKACFTVADLKAQTEGVECRKDAGVLDEIPGAYKDIDQVMANQTDLVEVVAELKQVLCVKG